MKTHPTVTRHDVVGEEHGLTHEELKQLLPLHAVGALDETAAAELEEHLRTCRDCAARTGELSNAAALVAQGLTPIAPPDQMKERIMERIHRSTEPHDTSRTAKLPTGAVVASAAGILVVVGWGLWYGCGAI